MGNRNEKTRRVVTTIKTDKTNSVWIKCADQQMAIDMFYYHPKENIDGCCPVCRYLHEELGLGKHWKDDQSDDELTRLKKNPLWQFSHIIGLAVRDANAILELREKKIPHPKPKICLRKLESGDLASTGDLDGSPAILLDCLGQVWKESDDEPEDFPNIKKIYKVTAFMQIALNDPNNYKNIQYTNDVDTTWIITSNTVEWLQTGEWLEV